MPDMNQFKRELKELLKRYHVGIYLFGSDRHGIPGEHFVAYSRSDGDEINLNESGKTIDADDIKV